MHVLHENIRMYMLALAFTYIFTLKCHIQSYAISTEPWDYGCVYPAQVMQIIQIQNGTNMIARAHPFKFLGMIW